MPKKLTNIKYKISFTKQTKFYIKILNPRTVVSKLNLFFKRTVTLQLKTLVSLLQIHVNLKNISENIQLCLYQFL